MTTEGWCSAVNAWMGYCRAKKGIYTTYTVGPSLVEAKTYRYDEHAVNLLIPVQYRSDEEMAACEANLATAYAKYLAPTPDADTYDVLVAHGNVIRWLVCKSLGLDPQLWRRFTIGNCSVTALVVAPDGTVRMAAYSDTGHLPVEKQTWTGKGAGWMGQPVKGMK